MKSKIIELEEKNRCRTYQTEYLSKDKTLMTKGLAILCMVILHLFCRKGNEVANSHFLRTAGPHFPDSPGHIKRTAWDISRAEGTPPH